MQATFLLVHRHVFSLKASTNIPPHTHTLLVWQEKARRLQEARTLKEAEEMNECTFAPEIIRCAPDNAKLNSHALPCVLLTTAYDACFFGRRRPLSGPLHAAPVVPLLAGVSRHLELLALSRRKKEEQKKVEDRVWNRAPKGNDSLFTVPKPFALSQRPQRATYQG